MTTRTTLSYPEITQLNQLLHRITAHTHHIQQHLAQLQGNPNLPHTTPLSPSTAHHTQHALTAARHTANRHAQEAAHLLTTTTTIIPTYQHADTTLARQAHTLTTATTAIVSSSTPAALTPPTAPQDANQLTPNAPKPFPPSLTDLTAAATLTFDAAIIANLLQISLLHGFTQEALHSAITAAHKTTQYTHPLDTLLKTTTAYGPLSFLLNALSEFNPNRALENTYNALETHTALLTEPGYTLLVTSIINSIQQLGGFQPGNTQPWHDPNWSITDNVSVLSEDDRIERLDAYKAAITEKLEYNYDDSSPILDVKNLLLKAGELDALGRQNEAQIETILSPGPPTHITVIIPSTQEWKPWGSNVPNDLIGNLLTMQGATSDLQALTHKAIDDQLAKLTPEQRDNAQIMTVGFSQGGIVAAAIAATGKYNITHVITAGSPIAKILNSLPDNNELTVLALEQYGDPVPRLDAAPNPTRPGITTLTTLPEEESTLLSHNILRYAYNAQNLDPQHTTGITGFFSPHQKTQRYYGHRQ
ncbi:hypothetical protein [Lysinibacter sp. HNR]|uniref:hypothetical protein n=1 Tax=Lysinibacter sp. HNR TaxID=3031408 RepID=UPI0024355E90|nr:hypothetical protein [Lysinibacter sp. HNR]WGD36431.1 hypothetical protein FrondiHNR_08055 [Lysinibacter sp. HNR]